MSRSIKILCGLAGAMVVLSGPTFLLGVFMVYNEMGSYSPELNVADYFNSLLAKWVAPPVIMLLVGMKLWVVALIVWWYQQKRRPTASRG